MKCRVHTPVTSLAAMILILWTHNGFGDSLLLEHDFWHEGNSTELKPIDMPKDYTPYDLELDPRFPVPDLPRDNPLIEERIDLGRKLFFDPMLSSNNRVSCAACHSPRAGFSDPLQFSLGVGSLPTRRHSMTVINLAWKDDFFWDGRSPSIREQVLHPIQEPLEMGESLSRVNRKLSSRPDYRHDFERAFGSGTINSLNISLALEAYLLTLASYDSPFDEAMRGEATLSPQAQRGYELFMTEFDPSSGQMGAGCFQCHSGVLFTDNSFHNNGLIPMRDDGLSEFTGKASDKGKFATPSLRNVALTAPYMHDGRFSTLKEVVDHYAQGMYQSDTLDPHLTKLPKEGLPLTEEDKSALVAFLRSLTDPIYERPSVRLAAGNSIRKQVP